MEWRFVVGCLGWFPRSDYLVSNTVSTRFYETTPLDTAYCFKTINHCFTYCFVGFSWLQFRYMSVSYKRGLTVMYERIVSSLFCWETHFFSILCFVAPSFIDAFAIGSIYLVFIMLQGFADVLLPK